MIGDAQPFGDDFSNRDKVQLSADNNNIGDLLNAKNVTWGYFEGGFKPTVNVNHPSFQLGIAAWRKLPLWATRVIGPRLARNIP